eukprot:3878076-Pyramimonas_sp.AAC.1
MGAEDLARELEELESADSQHNIRASVEHAAAGLARGPRGWPQRLETQRQRRSSRGQCRIYLRGTSLNDCTTTSPR